MKTDDQLKKYYIVETHKNINFIILSFSPQNDNKALFHLAIAGGTASLLFKVSYMTLIHFWYSKHWLKKK